ncbi:MAG: hypothetical protein AB7V18_09850 [Pyrinomonadaceae bacterium]
MDLINELSSDLAIAVLVEGRLKDKIDNRDAKSLIAILESELARISRPAGENAEEPLIDSPLSH